MSRFKLNSDWGRTFLTIGFFSALHFGDARYVTKGDYVSDLAKIRDAIVQMDKSIALLETTRRVQDDHETRIRSLEQRKFTYEKPNHLSTDPVVPLFHAARSH